MSKPDGYGTSEILANKLAYRADSFKVRDVFDLAMALALDRPAALSALAATHRTRPAWTGCWPRPIRGTSL